MFPKDLISGIACLVPFKAHCIILDCNLAATSHHTIPAIGHNWEPITTPASLAAYFPSLPPLTVLVPLPRICKYSFVVYHLARSLLRAFTSALLVKSSTICLAPLAIAL